MPDRRIRSITKTVTWRTVAFIITGIVSYVFTGNFFVSAAIAGVDSVAKLFSYYFHERVWEHVSFGKKKIKASDFEDLNEAQKEKLFKRLKELGYVE